MTLTIEMKYEDDEGKWQDLMVVSHDALAIEPTSQRHFEYQVDWKDTHMFRLTDLISISSTRFWQFTWLNDGHPAGLMVRRVMTLKSVAQDRIVLQTADQAGRLM